MMRNCFPSSTKFSTDQITERFFQKSHEVNLVTLALLLPLRGSMRPWQVIEPDRSPAASLINGRRQAKAGGPCKVQFCSFLTTFLLIDSQCGYMGDFNLTTDLAP